MSFSMRFSLMCFLALFPACDQPREDDGACKVLPIDGREFIFSCPGQDPFSIDLSKIAGLMGEPGGQGLPGIQGPTGPQGPQGPAGQDGKDVEACDDEQAQAYSRARVTRWGHFKAEYATCLATVNASFIACAVDNQNQNLEACSQPFIEDTKGCRFSYVDQVNRLGEVCGALILNPDGSIVKDQDHDGDGISSGYELQMGYDACSSNTFGCRVNDAELDADGDKILDGNDGNPLCNKEDPTPECVL